jgi:DNA polymerase III alpha subunit
MTYLGWLGIEQTETYAIIKKISKKKFKEKELKELKGRLIAKWFENTGKEDGFEDTWAIMEAFSKYAFNASHAYSYAYDSVYGAYLKAHYPYEFYAVMLQALTEKGKKNKAAEYKIEMREAFGISEGKYKFRKDNRLFSIDREVSSINPSIVSIKNFSQTVADELYSLRNCNCDNFVDILLMFKEKSSVGLSRIEDLIKIDYFSEFGNINKLLKTLQVFNKGYDSTKRTFKKQISKNKVEEYGVTDELVKAFSHKETDKTYMMIDMYGMVKELNSIEFGDITSILKAQYQYEVLNNVNIIDRKCKGIAIVQSVDTKYSPKLECYALANGNTLDVKIDKRSFKKNPLKEGDAILIKNIIPKPRQTKNEDDEWVDIPDTKVWWITDYKKASTYEVKIKK